eukprot:m.69738 g.69738  ORF g.69738 m.69738 type:complete len:175 (-) comp13750_c0_seq3:2197-2721(-)
MHLPDLGVSTTRFARMLSDFEPKTIIFYDMELGCLREVESYQSIRPDINIEVRLMVYQSSFQEQSYLSSIRHEKEAFERMIQSKRVMALPADQDGRRGIRQQGERQLKSRVSQTISSRKGGGRVLEQGAPRPKVCQIPLSARRCFPLHGPPNNFSKPRYELKHAAVSATSYHLS